MKGEDDGVLLGREEGICGGLDWGSVEKYGGNREVKKRKWRGSD